VAAEAVKTVKTVFHFFLAEFTWLKPHRHQPYFGHFPGQTL
jgi:hypothetical protein